MIEIDEIQKIVFHSYHSGTIFINGKLHYQISLDSLDAGSLRIINWNSENLERVIPDVLLKVIFQDMTISRKMYKK